MRKIYVVVKGADVKPLNPKDIVACKATLADAQQEHKIMCNAAHDTHAYSILGPFDETPLEAFVMLHGGMELITPAEFLARIDALGYKLQPGMAFNYFNTGNERHYAARSVCYYVEKDSGLRFCEDGARRDKNYKDLQYMRQWCFVYHNNRIWEL